MMRMTTLFCSLLLGIAAIPTEVRAESTGLPASELSSDPQARDGAPTPAEGAAQESQGTEAPTAEVVLSPITTASETEAVRRPGLGLWIGGLVMGLVGFATTLAGIGLVFSDTCFTTDCENTPMFAVVGGGIAIASAGIIMMALGRRRMRRADTLPALFRR